MLVNNFVLNRFLGCCPFLGVSKKTETALGMSVQVGDAAKIPVAGPWRVKFPEGWGMPDSFPFRVLERLRLHGRLADSHENLVLLGQFPDFCLHRRRRFCYTLRRGLRD